MKTSLLYGILADANSKTRVRCVFCGVYIPKASKCIEQHTNGTKHKENIELMATNGISFNNDVLYCKPCKHTLTEDESVSKHIDGDDHANWMTAIEDLVDGEFISLEPYLSGEKDEVYCEVCNTTIDCALLNIEEHVNSFNHRANVCDKLKPLNGIFPVENNDEVWCKVCDIYLENTVKGILEHIDDDEQHVDWFSEMEDLIEDHEISIEDYLTNEHENNAFCNTCQIEIICNAQSIEDHINSDSHLSHFS
ncbi:uncharacterized protein LOC126375564 [Pectinophora gossypiella]|uniref:uncharacterized protein LOC126375564 n=1 Tax=Pectinophora gossypiella TaxID=13191 RepID=UPI00214F51A1|nr:uncharacterized protein LOC126375564 [Pectinophora gossypiella]